MKRFNKNKKRNNIIIISVVILLGIVSIVSLIKSHAYFNTSKSFDVLKGKVPNFTKGDITLAVLVDGKPQKEFPDKNGHKYIDYECTNKEVILEWYKDTWSASLKNIKNPTICTLKFETLTNLDLNGSEPVIKDDLIPVVIANDGTVTKTKKDDSNWYDYNESKWANAVILEGNDTYSVGQTIPEEAINAYFVWIPKYRYKLFNVEGNKVEPQEIEIEIGDYNTVNSETECIATNASGDSGTCENGKWMTHPVFTSLDVTGFWVGKFETGYKGSTDSDSALKFEISPEKVQIKPNVYSWRNVSTTSAYNTSLNYKKNLDSHMMKNTEWGDLTYFTDSKYGLYQRGKCSYIDNYDEGANITGSSNISSYFDGNVGNSTTSNISGIYDMFTCYSELTAAAVLENEVNSFIESAIPKFFDKYLGKNKNIIGDATIELEGWSYVAPEFPFKYGHTFLRYLGFGYGNAAYIARWNNNVDWVTFRVVLSPNN